MMVEREREQDLDFQEQSSRKSGSTRTGCQFVKVL
jgi:hypothetical protein